jgi:LDH2 family malate/lactate/ureidoglycolate dehydrogenase
MSLRRALASAPIRDALEVLLHSNFPRMTSHAGADAVTSAALQHARSAGYYDFHRALQKLTEDPPDPRKKLPEPWGNTPQQ